VDCRSCVMDLPKATPLELGMTGNLDRFHIGPIPVEEAAEGEELKEEVREITDEECLELLEGIEVDSDEVKRQGEYIRELTGRLDRLESSYRGSPGDPGHVERTDKAINDLKELIEKQGEAQKEDIHEGFSTQNQKWNDFEKILIDMVREQNTNIKAIDVRVDDHEGRIKIIEDKHAKEEKNAEIIKKAVIGAAVGGGGLTGLIIAGIKGLFTGGH